MQVVKGYTKGDLIEFNEELMRRKKVRCEDKRFNLTCSIPNCERFVLESKNDRIRVSRKEKKEETQEKREKEISL